MANRTRVVMSFKHANEAGRGLLVHDKAELVFQKIMLDTGSYAKTVRVMRETYMIGITLDVIWQDELPKGGV